jgi:hypothetical protein
MISAPIYFRVHHFKHSDLEITDDTKPGSIVERGYGRHGSLVSLMFAAFSKYLGALGP